MTPAASQVISERHLVSELHDERLVGSTDVPSPFTYVIG